MRTRVKICGITRRQDAEFAVEMGADALGFVFYSASPRAVNIAQAIDIAKNLPPFVSVVALFVDAEASYVKQCMEAFHIDVLQFHGEESEAYCQQFNKPYLKAVRMRGKTDLLALSKEYDSASALLLDSYKAGVPGGTGIAFNWDMIEEINKPVILAGGLTVENVAEAIKQVQPYAVDVSGGVEQAKGIKDHNKIDRFMQEVVNV